MDATDLQKQIWDLRTTLFSTLDKDPNQELTGVALGPLEYLFKEARTHLRDEGLVSSIQDVISAIEDGGSVRVADVLVVVQMMASQLGPPSTRVSSF